LQVNGEINRGRLAQIDSIAAEVGKLRRVADTFSQPGYIWNPVTNPYGGGNGQGIAYGNSVFVGGGPTGLLARSTDYGKTWANPANPFGAGDVISGMAFGNNVFVATGSSGHIARSTDNGATWGALIVNNFAGGSTIYCCSYGNGIFMAGDNSGNISTSSDYGLTWSALVAVHASTLRSLVFGSGKWIATFGDGFVYYSTNNGTAWTSDGQLTAVAPGLLASCFTGRFFVVGGASGNVWTSTDGINWTGPISANVSGNYITGLSFGNNTVVVVTAVANVSLSKDYGATWAAIVGSAGIACYGIAFGYNTFVTNNPMWSSWLSYGKSYLYVPTFTGFGTPTNVLFWWQRKPGSNTINVYGKFTTGVCTGVTAKVGLPVGLLSDSAFNTSIQVCGVCTFNQAGNYPAYCLLESGGVSYVTIGIQDGAAGLTESLGNSFNNGSIYSLMFELPVQGWN
jgi:photosystem II stability/assembly factor-like uncharacterized protein